MRKISTLVLISVLLMNVANAQRLKTEDFNYDAGQLTDSAGGANVSNGAWIPNTGTGKFLQVATGDLSYTNYFTSPEPNSGRLLLDSTTVSAEDAFTEFTAQNSNTLYTSFLLNVAYTENLFKHDTAIGDYFVALLTSTSKSSYTARLYIRKGSTVNTFNLGIAAQSGATTPVSWVNTDLPIETTNLITIAYEFITGTANDVAKLQVNPPYTASEPAADATSVNTGSEPGDLARFAVRQAYTSGKGCTPKCAVDAIKVSTSWSDGTLPLQLRSVSVINNNGLASLRWETCNEINVKQFEVQRSADAINFITVGTVAAKNTGCATQYVYNDTKMLTGTAFYRIKSVDKDGAFINSAIVSVTGKATLKISVFPNPVANDLVISHPQAGKNAMVQVVSISGKYLAQQKVQSNAVQTTINISALSKGTYIVVFSNNGIKQTMQFVKQ